MRKTRERAVQKCDVQLKRTTETKEKLSRGTKQRANGLNSRPVELGGSYSRRSQVQSVRDELWQPSFDGNAAPALAPEIQPKRKADKKQVATKNLNPSKKTHTKAAPSPVSTGVKLFVSCVFVFATIGFLNITFTSMAVASATQAEAISTQISAEREAGKTMEVEYGTLSNPATVKEKAAALGMETPGEVIQINMEADPVVTKDDGSIALCSTLKAAANE